MPRKLYLSLILQLVPLVFPVLLLSQEKPGFPIDPYVILGNWYFDDLIREKGDGEPILDTIAGKAMITGAQYPDRWFGKSGSLQFYFTGEKVSRIIFRHHHPAKTIAPELADLIVKDTAARNAYTREALKLDSLRRDSIEKEIGIILGPSLTSERTSPVDKYARFMATWINRGYSCVYKDYIEYGDIVFTSAETPSWVQGEFGTPDKTVIIQQGKVETRDLSWTYSLITVPSDTLRMAYERIFLLAEYSSGIRFLEPLPEGPPFCLPAIHYDDADGDGVPDAWIWVPGNSNEPFSRSYIYSQKFREPILIFNPDDHFPAEMSLSEGLQIQVILQNGTEYLVPVPAGSPASAAFDSRGMPIQSGLIMPRGFKEFGVTERNRNGSVNLHGQIPLLLNGRTGDIGFLDILYGFDGGGWEISEIKYACNTAR